MFECKKLDPGKAKVTLTQCIRFSELATMDCPPKKAIIFASKRHCRYDSTKTKDGPVGFKKLPVTCDVSSFYKEGGWLLKEPTIGRFNLSNSKPNAETVFLRNYIDNQTSDIKERTKDLERRITSTSGFYKQLNRKYSFRKLSREQMFIKLKKLNEDNKPVQTEEDVIYDGKILRQADEIYKNLDQTRKKFKLIENYQKTIKSLAQKTHELNFMNYNDKYMLEVLKKDRNVIEQFNNANYKFPLQSTHQANLMLEKLIKNPEKKS